MQSLKVLLFMMTAVLLLNSGCAVKINDFEMCSPIPGNLGAVCSSFLSPTNTILDQTGWLAKQTSWINSGSAVECTSSQTVVNLKAELEKLCSVAKCSYDSTGVTVTIKDEE